jgi:hypothetical protein
MRLVWWAFKKLMYKRGFSSPCIGAIVALYDSETKVLRAQRERS